MTQKTEGEARIVVRLKEVTYGLSLRRLHAACSKLKADA
jgi:hypothetical protein